MSHFPIHPTPHVHVFRTPNNKLQIRTEVKYQKKTILVKRISTWYDTIEEKNRKRVEIQQFNCDENNDNCIETDSRNDLTKELLMKKKEIEEIDKDKVDMYLTTY